MNLAKSKVLRSTKAYLRISIILILLILICWIYIQNKENQESRPISYEEHQQQEIDKKFHRSADSIAQQIEYFEQNLIKPEAAIKTKDILITPLSLDSTNGKKVKTKLASKTRTLRIAFKLAKNSYTKIGLHDIYVRILDKNSNTIEADKSKTFNVVDDQLQYTFKTTVYFANDNRTYLLDWTSQQSLSNETYDITLHADGYFSGKASFVLK